MCFKMLKYSFMYYPDMPIIAVIIRRSQEESETEKKVTSHAWKIKGGFMSQGGWAALSSHEVKEMGNLLTVQH